MNNYDYPLGSDTEDAPWNEEEVYCPECGSDVEYWDSGVFKGIRWTNYKCTECGYIISNAPDYD